MDQRGKRNLKRGRNVDRRGEEGALPKGAGENIGSVNTKLYAKRGTGMAGGDREREGCLCGESFRGLDSMAKIS